MKRHLKSLLVLLLVLYAGYSVIVHVYAREIINRYNPQIRYSFAFSYLPDRISFVNLSYEGSSVAMVTVDFSLYNILVKKRLDRAVNGLVMWAPKFIFEKKPQAQGAQGLFIVPYCEYMKIINGGFLYVDPERSAIFSIDSINGSSSFYSKGENIDKYVKLKLTANLQGSGRDKIYLDFYYFPYLKNKFMLNLYGTSISANVLQTLLGESRIVIDGGTVNFTVQVKGEMRKIYVNNLMQFKGLKVREEADFDAKAIFGVSVEQLAEFMKGSNGDFFVNFSFEMPDTRFNEIFTQYASELKASVGGRVALGIVTAPVRQVKDLIWNLTGENVIRIIKLFENKQE